MVQKQETIKEARRRAFWAAVNECKTPEEAAVRLGVSASTVMRFKRQEKLSKGKRR